MTREVSSAPCSHSNSGGEFKSKKWPSSPSKGDVHLGRSNLVWQVRCGGTSLRISKPVVRNGGKGGGGRKEELETCLTKNGSGGGACGYGDKASEESVVMLVIRRVSGLQRFLICFCLSYVVEILLERNVCSCNPLIVEEELDLPALSDNVLFDEGRVRPGSNS